LAVIGAGPIGCELSQAFARFGSQVLLIEKMGQILTREDRDAAERVKKSLLRDGVKFVMDCNLLEIRKKNGEKILRFECGGDPVEHRVDEILVGAGRAPNVQGLGLEAAGVEYDAKKGVRVNDRLQTTNRRIYAAGDICFPHQFTHTADATARIVIQNALFLGPCLSA
jgi:pyruvate/2-oxoglutarate dehydrogenase complex dihydrolipoamide dehydrogenase (E3) component